MDKGEENMDKSTIGTIGNSTEGHVGDPCDPKYMEAWQKVLNRYGELLRRFIQNVFHVGSGAADEMLNEFFHKWFKSGLKRDREKFPRFRDFLKARMRYIYLEWRSCQSHVKKQIFESTEFPTPPRTDFCGKEVKELEEPEHFDVMCRALQLAQDDSGNPWFTEKDQQLIELLAKGCSLFADNHTELAAKLDIEPNTLTTRIKRFRENFARYLAQGPTEESLRRELERLLQRMMKRIYKEIWEKYEEQEVEFFSRWLKSRDIDIKSLNEQQRKLVERFRQDFKGRVRTLGLLRDYFPDE